MLSEVALGNRITIVGGSMPERRKNGQLYNTCCAFGPDGNLKAKHSKVHLFDVYIPGDISFKESDNFASGDQPTIVNTGSLDLDFSFLEMNPFTLVNGEPYPLDMRAELDDTAAFKNFKKWGDIEFPLPFGRVLSPTESFIYSLDEKKLCRLEP